MYNIPLILVIKREMSPCTPTSAALHLPHGPGLPSNDIMEMSQNTPENKILSRSE